MPIHEARNVQTERLSPSHLAYSMRGFLGNRITGMTNRLPGSGRTSRIRVGRNCQAEANNLEGKMGVGQRK